MNRFATFGALYMTALFLESAERWRYPVFTAGLLVLGAALLAAGLTRRTFALFLAAATAHTVLVQFPDVANHVNIELYCNVVLLLGIGLSLMRRAEYPTDDDCFELVRPVLQASIVLVYAMAGFDKLNTDFLDPQVSCVGAMVGDLARMARGQPFGVPMPLLLVAGVGLVPAALGNPRESSRASIWPRRVAAFLLVAVPAGLALHVTLRLRIDTTAVFLMVMAGIVILWELVGGLLLLAPRCQGPCLAFSWAMHASLSLIGFVDFGSLAFTLLFTFLPPPYLDLTTGRLRLPAVGWTVPRVQAYFAVNVLSGVASGMHRRLVAGVLFNLAVLILIWPMLRALAAQAPRVSWPGVSLWSPRTPAWLYACPMLLLGHGLTSYLGLRTAGNFSMFSNLRTEGPRSNHLLLGANPLKLWHYQEDVVRFTRIDDRAARIGYNYQPLQGQALPVVEFRKLIHAWSRAGMVVPMAFEYRGRAHVTSDIAHDSVWRTRGRDWEMRLMDFRVIQTEGANRCRW